MKPLELTIYPREVHPVYGLRYLTGVGDPADWWEWTELHAATRGVHAHRLSDAELAAEWWKSLATVPAFGEIGEYEQGIRETRIAKTLERFATLPHYDEVPE